MQDTTVGQTSELKPPWPHARVQSARAYKALSHAGGWPCQDHTTAGSHHYGTNSTSPGQHKTAAQNTIRHCLQLPPSIPGLTTMPRDGRCGADFSTLSPALAMLHHNVVGKASSDVLHARGNPPPQSIPGNRIPHTVPFAHHVKPNPCSNMAPATLPSAAGLQLSSNHVYACKAL